MLALRVAILVFVALGTARFAYGYGYGFDLPPGASLNSATSHFYGSDVVPHGVHHSAGLHAPYGVDRVPGEVPPVHGDPHRQKMLEVIQHLTGAVEEAPRPSISSRSRPSGPCSCKSRR